MCPESSAQPTESCFRACFRNTNSQRFKRPVCWQIISIFFHLVSFCVPFWFTEKIRWTQISQISTRVSSVTLGSLQSMPKSHHARPAKGLFSRSRSLSEPGEIQTPKEAWSQVSVKQFVHLAHFLLYSGEFVQRQVKDFFPIIVYDTVLIRDVLSSGRHADFSPSFRLGVTTWMLAIAWLFVLRFRKKNIPCLEQRESEGIIVQESAGASENLQSLHTLWMSFNFCATLSFCRGGLPSEYMRKWKWFVDLLPLDIRNNMKYNQDNRTDEVKDVIVTSFPKPACVRVSSFGVPSFFLPSP